MREEFAKTQEKTKENAMDKGISKNKERGLKMIERTLIFIKPDGVQRTLVGQIIQRFENVGLKIVGMKMVWIDKEFSRKHYSAHVDKKFYAPLEAYVTSSPVVAFVIEGVDAVEVARKIVGSTIPKQASPGTIRGDFAHHSAEHADKNEKSVSNIIHASGSSEEAKQEIELWFKPGELHSYKTVHENHVF